MKILIIGGTKFIGKAIAIQALKCSHSVTVFNRGKTEHSLDVDLIKGDVENLQDFRSEILGKNFDIAIHCIAYTEKHAEDFRSLFKNSNTKLIALSSCDCYEVFQGLNRRIDKTEVPIREDSPLSSVKYYWSDSKIKGKAADKYDKNLMTDILMDGFYKKEFNLTIFRLPMVYGPGDHQYPGRHGVFIRKILDKKKDLVLSDREQCQIYTYGYVENIAAAVIHSLDKEVCNGKVYNLGERYSRTRRRWAELYATQNNWKFNFHIIPEELIRKNKDFRNAPPQHLITDGSLFERETHFQAPVSLRDAIKETFEFAKENPDVLGEAPDYSQEEKLIASYYSKLDELND